MAEEGNGEEPDVLETEEETPQMCNQCQTIPDQYISLKCGHNMCLLCLTQIYQDLRTNSSAFDYQIICPFDQIETILDEFSLSALQNTLVNAQNQNQELLEELQEDLQDSNHENPLLKIEEKSQEFPSENKHSLNKEEENVIEKRNREVKEPEFEDRIQQLKGIFSNNIEPFSFCLKHRKEIANLYCFSCDDGFYCIHCLVDGFHDHHNVKNLSKNPQVFNKKMENLIEKLQEVKQGVNQWIGELGSKRKIINNKAIEAKTQIINDFKELKERLNQKEKELLQKSEEYSSEKLREIDEEISILKEQFNKINFLEEKNKGCFYKNELSSETVMKNYKSFKSDLKKLEIQPKNTENFSDFKCYLNMESFYKYLENIQILKLEITGFALKKKMASSPLKSQKNQTKSYLLQNNNSFNDYHNDSLFMDFDNIEIKRKTMHEKFKFKESGEKKQYLFMKPRYEYSEFLPKRSLASINQSTSIYWNDHIKEYNRNSMSFMKRMKEIGVSRIDEKKYYQLKGTQKLRLNSLEKQRSLFEKNKTIF